MPHLFSCLRFTQVDEPKGKRFLRSLFQLAQNSSDPLSTFSLPMTCATLLLMITMVTTCVVQIAATRFTPLISIIFFKNKVVIFTIGYFVVMEVYVLIASQTLNSSHRPAAVVFVAFLLTTIALVLILPYFAYILVFLDPTRVMDDIVSGLNVGLLKLGKGALGSGGGLDKSLAAMEKFRLKLIRGTNLLSDLGLKAMQWRDMSVVVSSINAMVAVVLVSLSHKGAFGTAWFRLPSHVASMTVDFMGMVPGEFDSMELARTWLEWKIFRHLLILYSESLKKLKEGCFHVSIQTRRIGLAALRGGDFHVAILVMKMFNTYLRFSMNARDMRSAVHVFEHMRNVGEAAVELSKATTARGPGLGPFFRSFLEDLFMRFSYYGELAKTLNLPFLSAVAGHDAVTLCLAVLDAPAAIPQDAADSCAKLCIRPLLADLRGRGASNGAPASPYFLRRSHALSLVRIAAKIAKMKMTNRSDNGKALLHLLKAVTITLRKNRDVISDLKAAIQNQKVQEEIFNFHLSHL